MNIYDFDFTYVLFYMTCFYQLNFVGLVENTTYLPKKIKQSNFGVCPGRLRCKDQLMLGNSNHFPRGWKRKKSLDPRRIWRESAGMEKRTLPKRRKRPRGPCACVIS